MKALIVDDSLTVRMDLLEGLGEAGFETRACDSVTSGRAALTSETFDIVILDVRLGDGDGIDLLCEIRALPDPVGTTPVMLLSSESDVADRVRGLKKGADEYAGKPYVLAHVVARAKELVAQSDSENDARPTVLVIDDSISFREAICEALEAASYRTIKAETGEEGLQKAAAESPQIVIVDGHLPGIDGMTVIRRLRLDAAHRHTPCIMMTASEIANGEINAFEAGVDVHLHKRTAPAEVVARVGQLLSSIPSTPGHVRSSLGTNKVVLLGTDMADVVQSLRHQSFDVAAGKNAEDAVALFDVDAPACVIVQVDDAPSVCRKLRENLPQSSALLALIADDESALAVECLAAGADEVVARTTPAHLLVARVRAQLRRKRSDVELTRERDAHTERMLAEARADLLAELEKKNAALAAANTELEAFSYSVSHDLRAPLRSIDGFSRVLSEDYGTQLDDEGKAHIARILGATKRMGELIEDLLTLSRVTSAALVKKPVDLGELARSVGAALAERESANVKLEIAENLEAEGDPRLLRAVLENLLGNAWKFSSKREDPIVEVGATMHDGERAFFVRDNGVGFDSNLAAKLFRPFQRLHSAKEFEGTGIGLATVRRIVMRHGGKTWAEAPSGGGACMYFTLG